MKLRGFTHWLNPAYQDFDDLPEEEDTAYNLTIEYMKGHGLKFSG